MEIPQNITALQKGLEEKLFSCTEILDGYLKRIHTYDSKINSFITVSDEIAYEKARWVDKIIADYGKEAFIKYPLLGVTRAHKDMFLTKGIRTTAGSNVLNSYIPQYSATVVDKLNDAGSLLIGKTNCDAWAHGTSGENSDFGPTKNPWNTDYVPGGSSSGSAAALASNFCMVSTGTDTGGSVRQPASFCSIVGFKPSYGAVSRYGVVSMASSLDTVGHFTKTVEDSEKGFEIIDIELPHTIYAISAYYIIQPAEVSSNLARYDGIRYGNGRDRFSDEAKRRMILGTFVLSSGYYDEYYMKAMKVRTQIIQDFENAFKKA